MSLLRSSINTSSPPTETPPILQQNSGENSGVSVQNQQESIVEDDGFQNKTPEDQISPIIPLESGITLGDLLEQRMLSQRLHGQVYFSMHLKFKWDREQTSQILLKLQFELILSLD